MTFIMISINGMSFCIIAVLIAILSYLNDGRRRISLTPIIEVMVYLILAIIVTSLSFRQLTIWSGSLFLPRLDSRRINRIQDKLELYQ